MVGGGHVRAKNRVGRIEYLRVVIHQMEDNGCSGVLTLIVRPLVGFLLSSILRRKKNWLAPGTRCHPTLYTR